MKSLKAEWNIDEVKSLFTDLWHGEKASNVSLQGLEHVIQITAADDKIYFRSYKVVLKKSGLKTPRVEVEEIGPSFDFVLRRTRLGAESLYKLAMKQPKALKPKKVKNMDRDVFGTKTGRIHMQTQDLNSLQTRKMKGLKRNRKAENSDGSNKRRKNKK